MADWANFGGGGGGGDSKQASGKVIGGGKEGGGRGFFEAWAGRGSISKYMYIRLKYDMRKETQAAFFYPGVSTARVLLLSLCCVEISPDSLFCVYCIFLYRVMTGPALVPLRCVNRFSGIRFSRCSGPWV